MPEFKAPVALNNLLGRTVLSATFSFEFGESPLQQEVFSEEDGIRSGMIDTHPMPGTGFSWTDNERVLGQFRVTYEAENGEFEAVSRPVPIPPQQNSKLITAVLAGEIDKVVIKLVEEELQLDIQPI